MAISIADMATYNAELKEFYLDFIPENLYYQKKPAFAMLRKDPDFVGRNEPTPFSYSDPQGVSADFQTAQNAQTSTQWGSFLLTRASNFGLATIQNQLLLASRGKQGAFVPAMSTEIERIRNSIVQDINVNLYGNGTGLLSTALAGTAVNVIVLQQPTDVRRFNVNMSLEWATSPTVPAVPLGAGVVVSVDRDNGILTYTLVAGVAAAPGNQIFRRGSRGPNKVITGFDGWLTNDPTELATPFFSQVRSADPERMAGVVRDYTGLNIDEAVINLAADIDFNGGSPDWCFMNTLKYAELCKTLGSKVLYDNIVMETMANVSFRAVRFDTEYGEIKVIPDSACPINKVYLLQSDTWSIESLNECVHIDEADGNMVLRSPNSPSVEVRLESYAQVRCKAPAYSGKAYV